MNSQRESHNHQQVPIPSRVTRGWRSVSSGVVGAALILGLVTLGPWDAPRHSQASETQISESAASNTLSFSEKTGFADIVQMVTPAVVNITVSKEIQPQMSRNPFEQLPEFFGMPGLPEGPQMPRRHGGPPVPEEQGAGSGVIVSSDGYVMTNNHVVDQASEITVTLPDKREFTGKVIGLDPQTDLAVVKIDGENLPFVRWGDSSKLRVGEYVLAVGNPFGLNSTVTSGIVSALGRGGMGITQYEDFIQTDAAINPGNSGGALINTKGELIGINTAIFSQSGGYQGVGFAVPTNLAKPVYAGLVSSGKVVRGFLGVGIQEVTSNLAESFNLDKASGALVTNVAVGSPADQAGLQRGDVIVDYQGKTVADPRNLQQYVIRTNVGSEVKMSLIRDGRKKVVKVVIRENQTPMQMARNTEDVSEGALAGVAVQNLDERLVAQLGVSHEVNGVVVLDVDPRSQAAKAGLVRGDIISEINRKPVQSEEDYAKIAAHLNGDQTLVFIHRGKGALYLNIKV
ncbi:MAG: MucD protein [Nitrospirales bacterium]|nr:MAG: MucD protein [Nitrospirales bacterium]